jgi:3D (Asp-Asp-Asp) domain-containing protein
MVLATEAEPVQIVEIIEVKPQYKVVAVSTHSVTAYTSDVAQCDEAPCITANGFNVCAHGEEDVIAANFLKFGTKVRIPELFGDRVFTVQDRMNRRFPNHVDVWMKDRGQAIDFGVQKAQIEILADNI